MKTLKKYGKRLLNWAIVSPWVKFREWLNKSKFVAFILGGLLFGTFIFCFLTIHYEYKEVFNSKKVVIIDTSHALASTERESADSLQGKVEQFGASPSEEDAPAIEIIKRISKREGIDWKMVYAVCLRESGCNMKLNCEKQVGLCDGGLSFGSYQIYNPSLDPERKRMAENFEEATLWTIKHGYRFKDNPAMFFKNHNGIAKTTNQWYVDGTMEIYESLVKKS